MHSSFRISNSSDSNSLHVHTASLLHLPVTEKGKVPTGQEELQLFIQQELLATKLGLDNDMEEEGEVDRLQVEPHSLLLMATPITTDLLATEEKARARELARAERLAVTTEESTGDEQPVIQPELRRKAIASRSKLTGRESKTKVESKPLSKNNNLDKGFPVMPSLPLLPERKPPDLPSSFPPMPRFTLPTTPIPVSELPPTCLRSPPLRSPPMSPLLQNLLPIPPQRPHLTQPLLLSQPPLLTHPPVLSHPLLHTQLPLQAQPPLHAQPQLHVQPPLHAQPPLHSQPPILTHSSLSTQPPVLQQSLGLHQSLAVQQPIPPKPPTTPTTVKTSGDLISIQVPMAGPDGSQTLQTINVPRSVLAGASDRPILLTVTPKNGINKGQKQIVVLTKNSAGSTTPGSSPGVKTATITTTNMTLNQKKNNVVTGSNPTKSVQLSPRASNGSIPALGTQLPITARSVVNSAPLGLTQTVARPGLGQQNAGQLVKQPSQVMQQIGHSLLQSGEIIQKPGQVSQLMQQSGQFLEPAAGQNVHQTGQLTLNNGQEAQQVVGGLQQATRVVQQGNHGVQQQSTGQTVRAVVQGRPGQATQVIRGQLIQTSQGQVLVQPGGRQILLGSNVVTSGGKLVVTGGQGNKGSRLVAGSQLLGGQVAGVQDTLKISQSPGATQGTTQLQGVAQVPGGQNVMSDLSKVLSMSPGGVRVVNSDAQTPPGRLSVSNGNSSSVTPDNNSSLNRILAALGNRGLVSQQNGKFYYVGDKGKSPVAVSLSPSTGNVRLTTPSPAARSALHTTPAASQQTSTRFSIPGISSLKTTGLGPSPTPRHVPPPSQCPVSSQQNTVVIADASSLESFTASPHMLKMASSLLQNSSSTNSISSSPVSSNGFPSSNSPLRPTPTPSTGGLEDDTHTFYYRDPALPQGWYLRCNRTRVAELSYQVETVFFSPDGAMLRSQAEVAAYLTGQLIVTDKSHRPSVSLSRLPWKSELDNLNQQFVPRIQLPVQKSMKRPMYQPPDPGQEPQEKIKAGNMLFL